MTPQMTDYRFIRADITVTIAEGREIPFWREILCHHSQALAKIFGHNTREKVDASVEIDGTYDEVLQFLAVLHPVKPDPITPTNVYVVFRLAHLYECPGILEQCFKTMETMHTVGPVTLEGLVNHVVDLWEWAERLVGDVDIHTRLQKILTGAMTRFESADLDLSDPTVLRRLPEPIWITLLQGLYNKKTAMKTCIKELESALLPVLDPYRRYGSDLPSTREKAVEILKKHACFGLV